MVAPFSAGLLRRVFVFAFAVAAASLIRAQSTLPAEPVRLDSTAAFQPLTANWKLAGDLAGDPRRDKTLAIADGTGVLVCNPGKEKETRGHLFTAWDHGDLDLDVEFLLVPGSNSGVYLQGRYEVQLFDSWGVRAPTSADCGGIYERVDPARGKGKERFEGHAPRANACRAPGLWQTLHIEFQAPRFDDAGRKTRNARFTKVVLNGFTVQENVEVTGPTNSAAFKDEKVRGPLMIQGDHGPVAIREMRVKRFEPGAITATDLHYTLYAGDFKTIGAYDATQPKSEGVPARFAHGAVEKTGRFALVFTGTMDVPRAGAYRFAIESGSMTRLTIDDRPVVTPLEKGSQPGIITLTAGRHAFRADLVHTSNGRPNFEIVAEGPGLAPQTLTARDRPEGRGGRGTRAAAREILIEPTDRVRLQRGFVPFDPRKRLYAASVGTPGGAHFAYDFETGAILRAWRGKFLEMAEMWEGRGEPQLERPAGPALTFNGKPAIALIENAAGGDWPDRPEALWASQGYVLEADGTPVFLATLADVAIRDRIASLPDGRGLARTLQFTGKLPSWSAWVLLAEAEIITTQPDGRGWVIGQREWYVDWPADAPARAIVRTVNGRQQLAVPLSSATLEKPLTYSIIW